MLSSSNGSVELETATLTPNSLNLNGYEALASSINSQIDSAALAKPGALVVHGALSWLKCSSGGTALAEPGAGAAALAEPGAED